MKAVWSVRLTATAERDFGQILRWTAQNFGPAQAKSYSRVLTQALLDLASGPSVIGARTRPDLGSAVYTLHVNRKSHKGRHFVVFRADPTNAAGGIEVLRLLHDRMDLEQHVSEE